jgi:hypothetical protein
MLFISTIDQLTERVPRRFGGLLPEPTGPWQRHQPRRLLD